MGIEKAEKYKSRLENNYERVETKMVGIDKVKITGKRASGKKKRYEVTGMFDGFRIDRQIIEAKNEKEAKEKFRKSYKQPRKVTDVKIWNIIND